MGWIVLGVPRAAVAIWDRQLACGPPRGLATVGRRLRHVYLITVLSRGRSPVDDTEPADGSGSPDGSDVVAAEVYGVRAPAREVFGAALSLAGSEPGGGDPEVDPAGLLTADELSAAFGRRFGPPRSLTPDRALPFLGVRMCEYDEDGPDRARVQIQTVTGRIARAMLERVRGEPLPGVGEEAYLRGDAVAVLQGDVGLAIHAQHVDGATTRAALRQLAAIAACRLPSPPPPVHRPIR